MFDFKNVSNSSLLLNTKSLVERERRITVEILFSLNEIGRRRALALEHQCRSMNEYAIEVLGYSEASAQRRISAARALLLVPDMAPLITSGDLNVTNVARVFTFIKKLEAQTGEKLSVERKAELFRKAEKISSKKLEMELAEISPRAALQESVIPVMTGTYEVKLFLTEAELSQWNELRGLLATQMADPYSNSELQGKLITIALAEVTRQKSKGLRRVLKVTAPSPAKAESKTPPSSKPDAPTASETITPLAVEHPAASEALRVTENTRYIPRKVAREVYARASGLRCEHRDESSSKRCGSTFKPEIHHLKNFSDGGSSTDPANLRVYCRAHNQTQAYRDFGYEKIRVIQEQSKAGIRD